MTEVEVDKKIEARVTISAWAQSCYQRGLSRAEFEETIAGNPMAALLSEREIAAIEHLTWRRRT